MQNPTTGVEVLTTQLAWTDRRALSQARYSALHLAEREPPRPRARTARVEPMRSSAIAAHARTGGAAERPAPQAAQLPAHARASVAQRGESGDPREVNPVRERGLRSSEERRWAAAAFPRRIERELRGRAGRDASFTVRCGDRRVHLVVRANEGRTRVVAVCAPDVRPRVERALAHARFALAGRGFRAEAA